ncbi:MAG: 4-(cytidine 5'-diphospho)-2-C-methyl-D-erythritol kinase [Acidobacteria bacterium]|nr:4-(cytidine 5'-diphospho)-2-C-methyl-D-erythritol kinase [Acidobacteriota bacterium]
MSRSIRLRAFAKINLGLKIVARRPDGFHEIRTVFQTIGLHDSLEISLSGFAGKISVECDDPGIPKGEDNLVHRTVELWRRERKFKGGIDVRLTKGIPAGSGLGGASADAAATLSGLESLAGNRLSFAARLALAAQLGSDVPFFLWGGRALGIGRGEEVYPLADLPRRLCLLVFPGFAVSTGAAYQEAGRRVLGELTEKRGSPRISLLGEWSHFPLLDWGPAENDFERVVFARWPELARWKRQLIRAGAETASLTGSGSALFGLFDSARKLKHAQNLAPRNWKTFRTRTVSRAEYVRAVTSETIE